MAKNTYDYPIYLFNEGTNYESYKFFCPCFVQKDGKKFWRFRVWAPNAKSVSVVGDHNNWDRTVDPMERIGTIPTDKRDEYCEPNTIELSDGTLLCHFRAEGETLFTLYQTTSADGGRTWSTPRRLLPDTGGAPAHLLLHSSGVLLSAYGYRSAPYGVRVMCSTDNGATWDIDHVLYDRAADDDCGYPASVELDDGTILTVFYAHTDETGPAVILQQHWDFEM